MRHWNTITKAGAAATVALLVGLPANAMTCEEFTAMSEDSQRGWIMGLDAGRMEAREMARGDMADASAEGVSTKQDDSTDGGREEAREDARGAPDVYVQVVEDCQGSPGMNVTEVFPMADPKGMGE
ncbi:MAG: hypothetical protein RIA08_13515 [Roseovarius sp.]|uniref:hypothetical protein n=1 Tax=Roseovarius sp. TaxID=1486281 RepID=UPI0032EB0FBD